MTITKEQAFEQWLADNSKYIEPMDMTAWLQQAFEAGRKSAVSEPVKQCGGIPRKGCNYLTACGQICNKCGQIHHLHQLANVFATPPSEAKPLTDEQIFTAVRPLYVTDESAFMGRIDDIATARAIEQAHGIVALEGMK